MTSYVVGAGDSFESISRSQFGTVDRANDIIAANPGATNPPVTGSTLFLPVQQTPVAPVDSVIGELSVTINGERFTGWTNISFSRVMDSFGSFDLLSLWDPDNAKFRDIFRPFGYQNVSVFEGDELLFNGTIITVSPEQDSKSRTVNASGYSLPGVANDCTPPISSLPLERDSQNIEQIATQLLKPFGITVEIDGDSGPAFQREALSPTKKILAYLIELATQRNLIITDTPLGGCKFQTETDTGNPVAILKEGQAGITSITPRFSPQNYYSHISGQGFTVFSEIGADPGSVFTVINERLTGVLRPFTFVAPDAIGGEIKTATEAKAGRMIGNAVSYSVVIPSWRDPSGNLWQPNTTMMLRAPGAMIYQSYEFLIREVRYIRNESEESVILTLVIPGSFKGEIPEVLPWEE